MDRTSSQNWLGRQPVPLFLISSNKKTENSKKSDSRRVWHGKGLPPGNGRSCVRSESFVFIFEWLRLNARFFKKFSFKILLHQRVSI